MSYAADRAWADQYLAAICDIVGPRLLVPAPFEVDAKQATDLIVLKARDMTIAARMRRPEYATRYPWEFTLRCRRDNGTETEASKILHGWCDWYFYGFAHDTDAGVIARWFLLDMGEFRYALARFGYVQSWAPKCELHDNHDGTHFMAFDVRRFPVSLIIASSAPVHPLAEFER